MDVEGKRLKVMLSIDPIKFPLTGIGRYTYELARNLSHFDSKLSLRYMSGTSCFKELPDFSDVSLNKSQTVIWHLRKIMGNSPSLVRFSVAVRQRQQAKELRKYKDCIYHGPNFYLPEFEGRSVVTIHDLSVFHWPKCHPKARVSVLTKQIERSVAKADIVLTDSEFTRKEIASFFGRDIDTIKAVPLGSSGEFYQREYGLLHDVIAKWKLVPDGYSLFTGTIEPRKNIETLLDAYERLPVSIKQRWPLVLAGYNGWENEALHKRIQRATSQGWVKYLGFVPSAELPFLYAGARAFLFPTLYEGFGLPVLEAMASGTPVVCSNSSSLPEVVGMAALMCDAADAVGLSLHIERSLTDDEWRSRAVGLGLKQSSKFSWKKCAELTLDAYCSL